MELKRETITVELDLLDGSSSNPNSMSDEQLESLKNFIASEGVLSAIHIRPTDDGRFEIVDGHHRVKAARMLGLTTWPAIVEDIGDEKATIRRIGLNKHKGELNLTMVSSQFAELHELGHSLDKLSLTGFDVSEVEDLLRNASASLEEIPKAVQLPELEQELVDKPQTLELEFRTADEKRRAKRALKKAAGKGGTLGDGLLRLLAEEHEVEEGEDDDE